jgi:hypothetical protein
MHTVADVQDDCRRLGAVGRRQDVQEHQDDRRQEGMRVLEPPAKLPTLPSTKIAVIGEEPSTQHLVQPLVALLTEGLMSGAGLT